MRRILFAGVLLPLLSACGPGSGSADQAQQPAATAPTVAAAATPAAVTPPPAKAHGPIWFEPSALSACGKPEKAIVHWTVGKDSDVKEVNIMGVRKDGTEVLFSSGGRYGTKETGAWMRGGSEMVLHAKATGAELGRVKMDSLPCSK